MQFLKGVGPARAELLERLGLHTVRDVLFFFPRDYQDLSDERDVDQLEEGKLQSVRGVVEDIDLRDTGPGRCILGVSLRCPTGHLRAIWFNQPFMREKFNFGQRVMLSGKPKYEGLVWQMHHPRVETLDQEEDEPVTKMLPVYPLTEGLLQWQMRKIIRAALEEYARRARRGLSRRILAGPRPLAAPAGVAASPFPQRPGEFGSRPAAAGVSGAFYSATGVGRQAAAAARPAEAPTLEATAKIDARIRRLFPFELTAGQQRAIAEISADMAGPLPMNRLLQGDVGSGKTVVAVYAMLLAVAHGYQAVLMAPTEVLARQHALTLGPDAGRQPGPPRPTDRRADEQPAGGAAATDRRRRGGHRRRHPGHHSGGRFLRQARPGGDRRAAQVRRAAAGGAEGQNGDRRRARRQRVVRSESRPEPAPSARPDPHYLVMTATPIPRSLTMTLFGDLDVSTLRDSPPGRQKVNTYLANEEQRAKWWDFFRKKLREGRQGYVVTPLVEEASGGADMGEQVGQTFLSAREMPANRADRNVCPTLKRCPGHPRP